MDEQPQADLEVTNNDFETIVQGQAATPETQSGVPNDPAAFQADYTRKYQELSSEKQAIAEERQRIEQEKAYIAQQRAAYQQYTPQYAPQQQVDPLEEQFGTEGAKAIRAQQTSVAQGVYQQLFAAEYAREEEKGRAKYADSWSKFDYTDPQTGQRGNQIMDLRCKGLSLEQAWSAMNPVDTATLEQQIKDKAYAEMLQKTNATPAAGNQPQPAGKGDGHAKSVAEAFDMAVSQLSSK